MSYFQTHGYIQLLGWAGLFIIAISLHLLPRLSAMPLQRPGQVKYVHRLVMAGLWLRFVAHAFLPYFLESRFYAVFAYAVLTAVFLVWTGVLLYLSLILRSMGVAEGKPRRPALRVIRSFLAMAVPGWVLYTSANVVLCIQMINQKSAVFDLAWNIYFVNIFLFLVLLPVAFAFSARLLPLYLHLRPANSTFGYFGFFYLISLGLQFLPLIPAVSWSSNAHLLVANSGAILKGMLVLWFIRKLHLFGRKRVVKGPAKGQTQTERPFGAFHLFIYSAYIWLALGALTEIYSGSAYFLRLNMEIGGDAIRHCYLLGFISHLIFGVSARMLPGLVGEKTLARAQLILPAFWLLTIAAVGRVAPLVLPAAISDHWPATVPLLQGLLGFSGVFSIIAVLLLTVSLAATARRSFAR